MSPIKVCEQSRFAAASRRRQQFNRVESTRECLRAREGKEKYQRLTVTLCAIVGKVKGPRSHSPAKRSDLSHVSTTNSGPHIETLPHTQMHSARGMINIHAFHGNKNDSDVCAAAFVDKGLQRGALEKRKQNYSPTGIISKILRVIQTEKKNQQPCGKYSIDAETKKIGDARHNKTFSCLLSVA